MTIGVMREARFTPVASAQASSLHPKAISEPVPHAPLRR